MAQLTNLNVSPYYDDFNEADDFHKVLFRPGFAVQARELTTLQSILQNQVEKHGMHIFKEGTVVIPGQVSYSKDYYSLALADSFAGETVQLSQFLNEDTPVILTGATTGVKAQIINYAEGTATTQPYLYLQYIQTGDDLATDKFADGENLTADIEITHTTTYEVGTACLTTFTTSAANTGSAVTVEAGVYFVRGNFVRNAKQTVVLSNTSNNVTARVGFIITENLITPEEDTTLTDNATGSSNYAAKGAHRLKILLTLSQLDINSVADNAFIELIRTNTGRITKQARGTDYSVLGETLASRTFDESGDYTVNPFTFEVKESLDNDYKGTTNLGVYATGNTTDDGAPAAEDLLTIKVSPGKAYIKGYEVEKIAQTRLDLKKARDVQNVNAGITTYEIGNYAFIDNVYSSPDIGLITGETTPYKELRLFTDFTETRGSSSGYQIGIARSRALEYFSGTVGNNDAQYKLYLFDIRMFTYLQLDGVPSPSLTATHSSGGVKITGVTSGATGFLYSSNISDITTAGVTGQRLPLTNVVGSFTLGEKLIASDSAETGAIIENSDNTDLTIANLAGSNNGIVEHRFDEARQIFMLGNTASENFTADLIMALVDDEGNMLTDGTDAEATDANEKLLDEDNSSQVQLETQRVAKLIDSEKNINVFRLPERPVKTLLTDLNNGASDTQFTVRRQFVGTTNTAGAVTFTARSNETFGAYANADYFMSVLSAGGGTAAAGDVILLNDSKIAGEGTGSITITDNTLLGSGAKVKVIATITRTSVQIKTKTTVLSKQLKVLSADADGAYGVRATDRDISFGRADVYDFQAVFDSRDSSADATAPELTLTTVSGTFLRGEKITGSASGAIGRCIDTTSPMSYTIRGGVTAADFTTADTITGASSGATAKVSAVTEGSANITSRFLLDTGMRDNYYDIARLTRKAGEAAPIGRLLIVYDYLAHGAGDAFTVDSYSELNGQMLYDDIPAYTATRVDPDSQAPTGLFDLRNCYDFRPTAEDITGASTNTSTTDQITGTSFNFENRQFDGTGAVVTDLPKPTSNLQADFEFYLPRRASLLITFDGEFKVIEGVSAKQPQFPKDIDSSLKLALFEIPAYTFAPEDVIVTRMKTQRFTMRDIGKIKDRLERLESLTALSLLERDAESFEIQDANGLSRFKSGFVVDNFKGHRVGDVLNADYEIAVDPSVGELRPKCVMRQTELIETNTTDALRATAGYQKTGDLITLPYTHTTIVDQPYATRLENIQPYVVSQWVGEITLSPATDNWFETETAPDLIVVVDNFSSVRAANANRLGTIWNSWESQWSGITEITGVERFSQSTSRGNRSGRGQFVRTILTERGTRTRDGVRTQVFEDVTEESQGTRIISQVAIPFCRPRTIQVTGEAFLPNTRIYPFFDGVDISSFVTPSSSAYTTDTTLFAGGVLKTTAAGKLECSFTIPDHKAIPSAPKFLTGEVEFRLTSSATDQRAGRAGATSDPATAGTTTYTAAGILNTEQETIISTRNARVVQTSVSQSEDISRDAGSTTSFQGWIDPLAQTFIVDDEKGCFITKVDVFFGKKDKNLPVWVEIRNVVNGYPGTKILPFGKKLLEPADINVNDTTGTTATTFTFDSPIYCKSGHEYCVVLRSNSINYLVWIAQMNELDVAGSNRVVSKQPTLGVLFKSQNNKTWNAIQSQDLKMHLFKADFTTSAGTVQLDNSASGMGVAKTYSDDSADVTGTMYGELLDSNPIKLTNSSTVMEVFLRDHGMYDTSNNVEIRGVKSGITTTLDGAITATSTSLTLTSASNFEASNLSSRCYLKIGDEILFGTLSSTTVSSLTRGDSGTTAAAHADDATIELYQLFKTPLTEINKSHTAIANIEIDKFTVSLTTAPTISGSSDVVSTGGIEVHASRNFRYETIKTNVATLELPGTSITAAIKTTTGTSPSGSETPFVLDTTTSPIPIGENFDFETTKIVASEINETNEMSASKSLQTFWTLSTTDSSISPVIDVDRLSIIHIANRLNNITSSSDIYPTTNYNASTAPEGDNNVAIYITKRIALESPATSLKVFFAGHRRNSATIKVLFKILRNDISDEFDDTGYQFFNTTGTTDVTTPVSLAVDDFRDYVYTAGVTDDGIGTPLQEFNQFAIKIVMQGTNGAEPPRIRDLRVIALAT